MRQKENFRAGAYDEAAEAVLDDYANILRKIQIYEEFNSKIESLDDRPLNADAQCDESGFIRLSLVGL
jgi:hypothetical protein